MSYFRHPRTTQERRWAHAWDDEEFSPRCRARRNTVNLPSAWDDIKVYPYYRRSWKYYRKHQYKQS